MLIYVGGSSKLWWGFSLILLIWYYLEVNYNALEDFISISFNCFKCVVNPFLIDIMFITLSTFDSYYRLLLFLLLNYSLILWAIGFYFPSCFIFFFLSFSSISRCSKTSLVLITFIKIYKIQFKNKVFIVVYHWFFVLFYCLMSYSTMEILLGCY